MQYIRLEQSQCYKNLEKYVGSLLKAQTDRLQVDWNVLVARLGVVLDLAVLSFLVCFEFFEIVRGSTDIRKGLAKKIFCSFDFSL